MGDLHKDVGLGEFSDVSDDARLAPDIRYIPVF